MTGKETEKPYEKTEQDKALEVMIKGASDRLRKYDAASGFEAGQANATLSIARELAYLNMTMAAVLTVLARREDKAVQDRIFGMFR